MVPSVTGVGIINRVDYSMPPRALPIAAALLCLAVHVAGGEAATESNATIQLHGHAQRLVVSGVPTGQPVIVSSGDGGWIHLAPHVAEVLAAKGFHVVGFDTRAYLETFTSRNATLNQDEVKGDYDALAEYATGPSRRRPILVGVSEGAGLSVLAATDAHTRGLIAGLVVLGMPNVNELAWRWRDAVIYLTHSVPKEPTFRVDQLVDQISPLPLAAVHSTNDEFVPLAEIERIVGLANQPKKLWTVPASDHRFSDNLQEFDRRLLDAVAWTTENATR